MARSEHNIIEDPTIRETRYGSTMVDLAPEGYAGWVVERRNPTGGDEMTLKSSSTDPPFPRVSGVTRN